MMVLLISAGCGDGRTGVNRMARQGEASPLPQ
jgi:hypothetical protein